MSSTGIELARGKARGAMTRKMAKIVNQINEVKSGKDVKKKHDKRGRLVKDEEGNPIIL